MIKVTSGSWEILADAIVETMEAPQANHTLVITLLNVPNDQKLSDIINDFMTKKGEELIILPEDASAMTFTNFSLSRAMTYYGREAGKKVTISFSIKE